MRYPTIVILAVCTLICAATHAQNCCAPAVAQQGVLGETATLPKVLEIGLHHEYLRSRDYNLDATDIDSDINATSTWQRTSLTLNYGVIRRVSVGAVVPYVWKEKEIDRLSSLPSLTNKAEGFGDITFLLRFSLLPRDFVNFRELSFGFGVKTPTGSTDRRNFGFRLPRELQPGTGSWDLLYSLTFYQGFEPVDFLLSGTYVMTGEGDESGSCYEFGNQFYYLFDTNVHIVSYLDFSLALSGAVRAHDLYGCWEEARNTGRHQIWAVPGVEVQLIPGVLGAQVHFEQPIYQDFEGVQLKSDFNIRGSLTYSLPLSSSSEEE